MGRRNIFRHRVYIALLVKCQRDRQTCNGEFHRLETLDVQPDNKSNNRVWENLGLIPLPVSLFSMSLRNVFRPFTIMLTQSKLSWTTVRYETLSPASIFVLVRTNANVAKTRECWQSISLLSLFDSVCQALVLSYKYRTLCVSSPWCPSCFIGAVCVGIWDRKQWCRVHVWRTSLVKYDPCFVFL